MCPRPCPRGLLAVIIIASALGHAGDLQSQPAARRVLDRDKVISLARSIAPGPRAARAEIDEARGRLIGARVLATENPVAEAVVGPRRTGSVSTTDYEVTLGVPVPLWGPRSRRIAKAEADVAERQHRGRDSARLTIGAALGAYYRVLHAEARLELAEKRVELASELRRMAEDRKRAGDVAEVEVNLARGELSRAVSETHSEKAAVDRAKAELASVLGLPSGSELDIEGELDDRSMFDRRNVRRPAAHRPDVLAAAASLRAADAEVAVADAAWWPALSVRFTYAREEEETDIFLVGLAMTLPVFERGQGARRESRARRERAAIELAGTRSQASAEAEAARLSYQASVRAVAELAVTGVPMAAANEEMARESYRAGKMDLATLLVVRREALETRREHADRLLDAALAGVDLAVATGAIP